MRFKRTISALVVAVLLVTSAAAEIFAQIEGESWTSPTYGFSVSWAGTEWQPDPAGTLAAVGPERLDRLHLLNGVSSLYFEGATRYQGDLPACVAEEANLLSQETGVSEIRPYRDEEGVQLVADGPNSLAAAFTLTLSIGNQDVELVDYVECRTLTPGQAVLIITLVTEPSSLPPRTGSSSDDHRHDRAPRRAGARSSRGLRWMAGGRSGAAQRRRSALRRTCLRTGRSRRRARRRRRPRFLRSSRVCESGTCARDVGYRTRVPRQWRRRAVAAGRRFRGYVVFERWAG